MTLVPLKFPSGLVRDTTMYANSGGWFDCDKVRFRLGMPEKMGGWQKEITTQFLGTCRELINWSLLTGQQYYGLGTNLKYYVATGGTYIDVTPIRLTTNLTNPFTTTNLSTTVTVTDVANGAVQGDFVTYSGTTGFAGIPAGDFNQEHQIVSIIDPDTYTITVATPANTGTTAGGSVTAAYQINVGLNTTVNGFGWGTGTWGRGTWGSDSTSGVAQELRIWSADTFGEDLVTNVRNGGLYYWDATNPTDRMLSFTDIPASDDAPTISTIIMVSADERHVLAFGSNPIGSANQDKLFVRWSDAENAAEWFPDVGNSAGGYRLSVGTYIVGAVKTRSEILIWTDAALYSMRWTGDPFTFSFTLMATGTNVIGPNGGVSVNDITVWMGREQFYFYDGRMQPLPCPVSDYIFRRINYSQLDKVFGFTNSIFDEVGWLYPSTTSECDSYVIYNYKEQVWYYGSFDRTAWLDRGPNYYPLATSSDSYLYDQEFGFDDGSTNPPSAIPAYIQSSPMESPEGGQGQHFMFITRLIPDITFRNSSATAPSVTMTIKMQNYPGAALIQDYPSTVTQGAVIPVETFTQQAFIRLRGRSMIYRVESTDVGVTWRLGINRLDVRPDGRR